MAMSMTLDFSTKAKFFFVEWQCDDVEGLILGCFGCMALGFVLLAMPQVRRVLISKLEISPLKSSIITQDSEINSIGNPQLNFKQKIISTIAYLIHALLHVVIMVIIMYMNFYVILSIIIGASIGYLVTSNDYCVKKEDHKCCGKKNNANKGQLVEEDTQIS